MSTPDATAAAGWRVHVCTWFGAGLLRPAPGTWGSLAAAVLAYALLALAPLDLARWTLAAAVVAATVAGIMCAPAAIARFGVEDPSQIVIDEVAGTWLAIAILPSALLAQPALAVIGALVLFRVFDIAKPWPVGWCERLPGGWGIMTDDLAAGAIAGCLATALLG
ncbi:MAG: phosphatidylglycerophosphatase A [Planctomycetes bacterium]|nr:phosphatidylglycerophosphatase A [Planctomycetota bacterium]